MSLTESQKKQRDKQIQYWKDREAEQLRYYITEEAEYQKHISDIYDYMMDQIQKEINGFYTRYAKAEGITLSEAKKRVSKLDIEAYERKAKRYVKNKTFTKEANEEMRLYNATMKINRLELLKANIGLELVDGFDELQKYYDEILTDRTLAEFERQAGILGKSVQNNAQAAHAIVNASFHNAKFSDRIWMYQDMMKAELGKLLQQGMIQGKNPRQLASHLEKLFGVSKSNAERLMRTELARVQTEAQKQSFERNGFSMYTFHVNSSCCDVCKALDGKHFKVRDMMPGENAAPMHPNCVLPDTEIIAPDVEAMMKSKYSGNVVEFGTSNGTRLTVTPNHIVLTARGWVRAKNLVKGDKVVYYCGNVSDGIHTKPTDDDSSITVENLFASIVETVGGTALSMPVSPIDFKGDVVSDSEVDIVFVNSKLRSKLNSSFAKFVSDSSLIGTVKFDKRELPFKCSLATLLVGIGLTADGIMSGLSVAKILFRSALTHHELVGLRLSSDYDTRLKKTAVYSRSADFKLLGDRFFANARKIKRDNFLSVDIKPVSFQRNPVPLDKAFNCRFIDTVFGGNFTNWMSAFVKKNDFSDIQADSQSMSWDIVPVENCCYGMTTDSINISNIVNCFSAFIKFDDIEFVSMRQYSGHVYDASSLSTLYIANRIISSNCRCSVSAHMDDDEFEEWLEEQSKGGTTEEWNKVKSRGKSVANGAGSGIIKPKVAKEENVMAEMQHLGKINIKILEKEFDKIQTDEIIVTNERIVHIKERHPEDYILFEKYGKESVISPDLIIKDMKHEGTVFMVKKLPETNLNVVVRVVLETDDSKLKNSVMTFYRIRERNLRKLIDKNNLLYKKE